jgi:hypothetical protein
MTTTLTLEQRVTQLEAELARVISLIPTQHQSSTPTPPESNWIDQLAGSITNEDLFLKALEYGKQHRQNS